MHTRFALLIGNNSYSDAPLTNPAADVQMLGRVLGECGFDVTVKLDQSASDMETLIADFGHRLERGGELGILFFAGHGCELGNNFFLLPLDCPVSDAVTTLLNFAIPLTELESCFKDAKSPLIVIIDACRDQLNTDGRLLPDSYKAQNKHCPPIDSIYLFSTASGNEASDGRAGANSPFVTSLVHAFEDYHLDIETLLKQAIEESSAITGSKQRPRLQGALKFPVPLSSVPRLTDKSKFIAYGVPDIYGLAQHPSGAGVLGWTSQNRIYHIYRQGAVPWVGIKSDEILTAKTAGDSVWIVSKSAGKTLLGRAQMTMEGHCESVLSFEIDLREAHALSVDTQNHRIYVAGRDEHGGKCAVYSYEEENLIYITPEACVELYAVEAISKDFVLLGGPNNYLSRYSFADGISHIFADFDPHRANGSNFYSFVIFPDRNFALAGGSGGEVHRLDLHGLIRHPPIVLPSYWRENELFEALGEVADDDSITRFIEEKETLNEDAREFLAQQLPTNNILTLLKSQSGELIVACSDIGRIYSLALRDLKILDFDVVANGRSSGQAIIDNNGDIFVDSGKGEVKVYHLLRQ